MLRSRESVLTLYKEKLRRKAALHTELENDSTIYLLTGIAGEDEEELRNVDAAIVELEKALGLSETDKTRIANECGLVITETI